MENILVSVIMANYNTPIEYLKEAIDSILNQSYTSFELIIIDDASTDGSFDYIEGLCDPRIVVIKNEKNMGPAVSRNRGLDIAKGKYIAIMDSDDISMPDRLQVELDYMERNTDVIVCGAWFEKFGIENQIRKPVIEDFEMYRCQLLFSNTPTTMCHSTTMLRKSALIMHNIRYDITLPKAQDYGMWFVCSKYGRMTILPKVLLKYRTHQSQISIKGYTSQAKCANLVSRRQLQALGIDYQEEEDRWRYDVLTDRKDYLLFYEWLSRINQSNKDIGYLNQNSLELYNNQKLCNGLKRIKRLELIKIYCNSNLHTRKLIRSLINNAIKKRLS